MNDTMNSTLTREQQYNNSITVDLLERQESLDPNELNLLTYGRPSDTCQGFASGKLGNMAGGFHFNLFDQKWYGSEHLYLCGEWSTEDEKNIEIQQYIRKMTSGRYAKSCSKSKYKNEIRPDYNSFRHQWMLWCVWQKCTLNADFSKLLKSVPDDVIIVELVKNDPVWAAFPDESGVIKGGNAMGKILTICRRCLIDGTQPAIDAELLNRVGIYILGRKISF